MMITMKLIDKEKVVEEIERIKKEECPIDTYEGRCKMLWFEQFSSFLDTLEVKGVDLEKEFYDFLDTLIGKDNGHLSEDELFRIAEYFFELGLNAKKGE